MDVLDAITNRRSINKLNQDVPPKELIEKILQAGNWAPTHHGTEPWRFYVITGDSRRKLGDVMANLRRAELGDPNSQESTIILESEAKKPLRAPVIIVVGVLPSDNPKVIEIEEFEAAGAAVQNMLLAAHSLGLGTKLRTGGAAYSDKVRDFLGMHPRERILGFIYLGYSDTTAPTSSRGSVKEKTKWLS